MFVSRCFKHVLKIKRSLTCSSLPPKYVRKMSYFVNNRNHSTTMHAFPHYQYSEKVGLIDALHSQNDNFIQVTWNSGKKSRYPYIFLRENCKCPSCFHPVVKQRLVIADEEKSVIDSIGIQEDGNLLECRWSDGHVSQYSSDWLHYRCLSEQEDQVKTDENTSFLRDGCELVTKNHNLTERAYEYEAIMADDKSLLHWCYDLNSCGLTLIQNAPSEEGVVFQLAKRIGHYKPTLHGESFPVKDTGDVNLAYTNLLISLHTDLPLFLNAPDIQALHCIEQKTDGGTNSFLDGFGVAMSLKENNPTAFDVLSKTKVPFHDNAAIASFGEFMLDCSRSIIQLNINGQLDKIYFNDRVMADFFKDLTPEQVVEFYKAKAAFTAYFNSEELVIRHKLKEGEIVIFDNNRVLHGRDSFTGERWLEGIYFDWDPIVSKIKVLNRKFGYPLPYKCHTPPHFSHQ